METSEKIQLNQDAVLLDVKQVGVLLNCSSRHVTRLYEAGKMPPPIRLGSLLRWPRKTLDEWVSNGCPLYSSQQQFSPEAD